MIGLLAAIGCTGGSAPDAADGPFYDAEPTITALTWGCTVEDAAWDFEILTEHWSGGGRIYMAREADTVEEHRIRSVAAAADGSDDRLALSLDIVADWRDAVGGSSTRWRCDDTPTLSFLAVVLAPSGNTRADCRVWGADPLLWEETDQIEGCEMVLEETADTGSPQ